MNEITKKNRVCSFDVLRVFAAFAVIVIHTSTYYVASFPAGDYHFIVGNFYNSLSRCSVPIFIMLSGALILREEAVFSFSKMWKYIFRILLVFYFWSFLYAVLYGVIQPLKMEEKIDIGSCISAFLLGHYHMWYLPMAVSLYLVTPILKRFIMKENARIILWLLLLAVVFQFSRPFLDLLLCTFSNDSSVIIPFSEQFGPDFIGVFPAYYITGWYLTQVEIPKKYRILVYLTGILGLLVTMVGPCAFGSEHPDAYQSFYGYSSLGVFLYSAALFLFVNQGIAPKGNGGIFHFFARVSVLTMGIYMLHPLVLDILEEQGRLWYAHWDIPVKAVLTFLICLIFSYILSKIPGIRKIIHV